jgi:hypothetical protein
LLLIDVIHHSSKHTFMKITPLLSGAIVAFLFFSCSKPYNNAGTTGLPTYSSMDDVYSQLALQPKVVTIDATTGGSFYGNSGTRYILPPNSLRTASGASVTGNVQISATEYVNKGDMIFSKTLPVSDGEPILSGGEFNISAAQNGQAVFLNPGSTITANMPFKDTANQEFRFFAGRPTNGIPNTAVNWKQIDTVRKVFINPFKDTLSIISDSLNYCNADRFMTPYPNYQTFTVTIAATGATITSTTALYAVTLYDTYKGVWPLGYIGSYSNGVYTEKHVPNIPVHFAVFGVINGHFYGGVTAATPVTGSNYVVTIAQVDAAAFKSQLNAL